MLTYVLCAVVGLFIIAARARHPRRRSLTRLGWAQFWLVMSNAVIGGITVLTGLNPYIVSSHFLAATALLTVAVLSWKRASEGDEEPRDLVARPARQLAWLLVGRDRRAHRHRHGRHGHRPARGRRQARSTASRWTGRRSPSSTSTSSTSSSACPSPCGSRCAPSRRRPPRAGRSWSCSPVSRSRASSATSSTSWACPRSSSGSTCWARPWCGSVCCGSVCRCATAVRSRRRTPAGPSPPASRRPPAPQPASALSR